MACLAWLRRDWCLGDCRCGALASDVHGTDIVVEAVARDSMAAIASGWVNRCQMMVATGP